MNENIDSIECRFAVHCDVKYASKDLHLVKEQIHYKDGTTKPSVRLMYDYKRDYYVTKKGNQNHKSKKEFEPLDVLDRFSSTERDLTFNAARSLGTPYFKGSLRDLAKSPYLYGTDISSTSLIKHQYAKRWDKQTNYTNAVFDTETDVIKGTNEIIMATISFKDKLLTVINKDFVRGLTNVDNLLKQAITKYIGDEVKQRNIDVQFMFVDREIDIVVKTIAKAHDWKPDFLSVWNIEFDMDKIIAACDRANIQIESIMSDPIVPPDYRFFNFRKGAASRKTASGVVHVFKPSQRWHNVYSPSSFYWIDAMQAYRHIRQGQAEERSYSLDSLLQKNLKIRKLKFDEAKAYESKPLLWHQFMQSNYPIEYIVYNMFDCISMEMLDEKTMDLQLMLPMLSGYSDFYYFNSQPRKSATDIYYNLLEDNKIMASTGSEMTEEHDKSFDLSGWIVMLPSHLLTNSGLPLIKQNKNIRSNIRAHGGD